MGCTESIAVVEDHENPIKAREILNIVRTGSTNPLHAQYLSALCDGCMQDEWRVAVDQADGIPVLVNALASPDRLFRFCAIEGLVNMSIIPQYRPKIGESNNLYENMIQIIEDKVYDDIGLVARELALRLLTNTCIEADDGSGFIRNGVINADIEIACRAGIVPAVMNWLADKRNLTTEIVDTSLGVPIDMRATWNRLTGWLPVTFFLRDSSIIEDPYLAEQFYSLVRNASEVPATDFACNHQMFILINCAFSTTDETLKKKLGTALVDNNVAQIFTSIIEDPVDRLLPQSSILHALIECVSSSAAMRGDIMDVKDIKQKLHRVNECIPGEVRTVSEATYDQCIEKLETLLRLGEK